MSIHSIQSIPTNIITEMLKSTLDKWPTIECQNTLLDI